MTRRGRDACAMAPAQSARRSSRATSIAAAATASSPRYTSRSPSAVATAHASRSRAPAARSAGAGGGGGNTGVDVATAGSRSLSAHCHSAVAAPCRSACAPRCVSRQLKNRRARYTDTRDAAAISSGAHRGAAARRVRLVAEHLRERAGRQAPPVVPLRRPRPRRRRQRLRGGGAELICLTFAGRQTAPGLRQPVAGKPAQPTRGATARRAEVAPGARGLGACRARARRAAHAGTSTSAPPFRHAAWSWRREGRGVGTLGKHFSSLRRGIMTNLKSARGANVLCCIALWVAPPCTWALTCTREPSR